MLKGPTENALTTCSAWPNAARSSPPTVCAEQRDVDAQRTPTLSQALSRSRATAQAGHLERRTEIEFTKFLSIKKPVRM